MPPKTAAPRAKTRACHVGNRLRVLCHVMAHSRRLNKDKSHQPVQRCNALPRSAVLGHPRHRTRRQHRRRRRRCRSRSRWSSCPHPNPSPASRSSSRLPPPSRPDRFPGPLSLPMTCRRRDARLACPQPTAVARQEAVARGQLPSRGKRRSPAANCRREARGGRTRPAAVARQEVVARGQPPSRGKRWSHAASRRRDAALHDNHRDTSLASSVVAVKDLTETRAPAGPCGHCRSRPHRLG